MGRIPLKATKQTIVKALPVDIDVEKLCNAFPFDALPGMVGKVIPHAQIESVIGQLRTSSRYKQIVWKWRERIEEQTGIWLDGKDGEAVGEGFKVLADKPLLTFAERKRGHVAKASARVARRAANVRSSALTPHERRVRDHVILSARTAHSVLVESLPAIEAPEPTKHIARRVLPGESQS
jgi:hypothetical protein